nr:hypothetical protein [Tanacetum cinerariifolium]
MRHEEPDSPEAAPLLPDYVHGLEELEHAPLLPDYMPGPKYLEYLAQFDEEILVEDQPYAVVDSPIALSPGHVAESDLEEDPEEDLEEDHADYPADGGDDDDEDTKAFETDEAAPTPVKRTLHFGSCVLSLVICWFKGPSTDACNRTISTMAITRTMNVAEARENVGSPVVQQSGIQCFNCKEFGHFSKECRKPKRVKDFAYHKEKMLLCKQAEQGVPLQAEQFDWLADTDEEIDEQELEAHYSYMEKIQ